jgi:hypothetical protein
MYLALFYTPSAPEAVTAQNPFIEVGGEEFASETAEVADPQTSTVGSISATALRAITLRTSAGAMRAADGLFRFVEAGTGHVYEVQNGVERKLSLTTFPQTTRAIWSNTASRVAIVREENNAHEVYVGTLGTSDTGGMELLGSTIPGNVSNIGWSLTGETLFYTIETNAGSEGVAWNLKTDSRSTLFTTPLTQITVSWGDRPLIVTRTGDGLLGYAYRTDHSRVTEPLEALQGIESKDISLFGGKSGGVLVAFIIRGKDTVSLARGVIPEKCAVGQDEVLCAVPRDFNPATFPDAWHRGEVSYSDALIRFDARTGEETILVSMDQATRKSADVARIEHTVGGYILTTHDGETFFLATETEANTEVSEELP